MHLNYHAIFVLSNIPYVFRPRLSPGITDLHQVRLELESASDVWFELGLALGLLHPTLRKIEENYDQDKSKCLREMLAEWLYHKDSDTGLGAPTWKQLARALRDLKHDTLAKEIERNL